MLNDAAALGRLLVTLRGAALPHACRLTIHVVDGGSTDESVAVAETMGARVLRCDGGRGPQLAAGCRAGNGELVLMLHADSSLEADALVCLVEALASRNDVEWGILGHDYDSGGLAARWALVTNRLRFHCFGIAFGDQGIFVRRRTLGDVGGVPELPLMEDVELSLRLRSRPRLSLGRCLTASARRFEQGGWRYLFRVFRLTTWWLAARARGAEPGPLAARMRQIYYGQ